MTYAPLSKSELTANTVFNIGALSASAEDNGGMLVAQLMNLGGPSMGKNSGIKNTRGLAASLGPSN